MVDKIKNVMDWLYSDAKKQAVRYRNLDAEVADCYFEFSHELYGVTTVATEICEFEEQLRICDYAAELRNKFWEEEVRRDVQ